MQTDYGREKGYSLYYTNFKNARWHRNYPLREDCYHTDRKAETDPEKSGAENHSAESAREKTPEQLEREQWWRDTGRKVANRFGRFLEGLAREALLAFINGSHFSVSVTEDGVRTKHYEFNGRSIERSGKGLSQSDLVLADQEEESDDAL